MEKTYGLDDLKKDYKEIQKKYDLPSFDELNKDFQIEKIAEAKTDFLMREVRKFMADKFSNYLRFIEAILHPVNASMFIFSIIKLIGSNEKKILTEVYGMLVKNEVKLIELDIKYVEEKEADFIKESYRMWQGIKEKMLGVIGIIKKNWDNKSETKNKDYFG